jgi:HK97 family phage prohead protease
VSLRIAGYAALFELADGDGDVIRKGAFAKSIAGTREKPLPLFWQHRPEQPIGTVELLAEDAKGLRVIARIDNADGRAAIALRRREANGLSFGYRARGYRPIPGGRLLEDVELLEISLVTHPLQHGARVHFVH